VFGISLRRRDHLKPDVVWGVLGKAIQSSACVCLRHRLEVDLDHVRMLVGNGKRAEKTKGCSVDVMCPLKIVSFQLGLFSIVWRMHLLKLCLEVMVTQNTNRIGMVKV